MIFNFQSTSLPYPTTICKLCSLAIENVLTFKYLGTTIHYNQTGVGEEEVKNRIIAAKSSFQQRKHIQYILAYPALDHPAPRLTGRVHQADTFYTIM